VGASDAKDGVGDDDQEGGLDAAASEADDGIADPITPRWYAIPVWRLLLLSLLGGWFYQTYWMYRSWQAYRASWGYSRAQEWHAVCERTGFRVSPFWRALLGIYCHGLFVAVRREARVLGLKSWIAPWPMLAAWCGASLAGSLFEPWPFKGAMGLVFLPVQLAVNRINERVTGSKQRDPISSGELAAAVFGAVMMGIVMARSPR
jgi:hypothetical protein